LDSNVLPKLLPRKPESHKGDFGHALLIGGSRGMAGAIAMAGMAASRCGAGIVRLGVPDCCLETVASFSPCYMLLPLPHDEKGQFSEIVDDVVYWLSRSTCVAVGPGMGRGESINAFVQQLYERLMEVNPSCPFVIDADALVALSGWGQWRQRRSMPMVLTPHPGEWARLCGVVASDRRGQEEAAAALSASLDCTILLKGHRTLITNGHRRQRNQTGTPAMATGGSGDVLTGIITALICQGMSTFDAASLGAYVHGRAGELALQQVGGHVVLPTELINFLPAAFAELSKESVQ
jgi:ADP-dependent NAD(P)H-hydrate dehydratase